jgi:hypothetical protein
MFKSPRKAADGAFLPEDFVVPTLVAGPHFQIRPITVHDVVKDYGAVVGSLDRLAGREFTFEQALIDVAWLQKEGQLRRSFSYVVITPDGERQVGRIHVAPSDEPGSDAVVVFWVCADEENSILEKELDEFVRTWTTTAWPFDNVRFPGRD